MAHEPWHIETSETRGGSGFDDRQNFSGKGSLDPNMLNPVPSALQKVPLTGGANESPQEQALTGSLFNPQSLESQKYTPQQIQQTVLRGATDPRLRQQVSPGVRTSNETIQPTAIIPGSVNQTNTLPIPGFLNEQQRAALTMLNNPSTLSTAAQYMQSLPPPRTTTGESITNTISNLASKYGLSTADTVTSPVTWAKAAQVIGELLGKGAINTGEGIANVGREAGVKDLGDPENWTTDNAGRVVATAGRVAKIANDTPGVMAKAFAGGLVDQYGGRALGMPMMAAATLGGLFRSPDLMAAAKSSQEKQAGLQSWSAGKFVGPNPGIASDIGGFLGRVASPVPAYSALNVAGEVGMPYLAKSLEGKLPDLPNLSGSIIGNAHGLDLTATPGALISLPNGQHIIAKTAAGPVIVPDESLKLLGWLGLATMGFGVALPMSIKKAYSSLPDRYQGLTPRAITTANGEVMGMSRYYDMLTSSVVSPHAPLIDIHNRWMTYWNQNQKLGLNPFAGQAVADALHIYTNAQQRSLISAAIEKGDMFTPEHVFKVPEGSSLKNLHEFSQAVPDLNDYLRLHMYADDLNERAGIAGKIMSGKSKAAMPAQTLVDENRKPIALADVKQRITDYDNSPAGQALQQGYKMWMDNIDETRRFVTTGKHATENTHDMIDVANEHPSTPRFSPTRGASQLINEVRMGASPVQVLEREMDNALSSRLDNHARAAYVDAHPPALNAFKVMTKEEIETKNIDPNAVLHVRRDGDTVRYIADPMVATLLKFDSQGNMGVSNAFFRSTKQLFQAATTNVLAPYFAPTAAFRTWMQHFVTKPAWSKAVGVPRMAYEIPRQLTYETAKAWEPQIKAINAWAQNNPLGQMFKDKTEVITRTMLSTLHNSFQWQLENGGGLRGTWLDQAQARRKSVSDARKFSEDLGYQAMLNYIDKWTHPMSNMWIGNKALSAAIGAGKTVRGAGRAITTAAKAIADSPQSAWALKNRNAIDPVTGQPIHISKLAAETRRLTGDPAERGYGNYGTIGTPNFSRGAIPFDSHSYPGSKVQAGMRVLGKATDIYHDLIPWSGVLSNHLGPLQQHGRMIPCGLQPGW